jgi:hypothetical protein
MTNARAACELAIRALEDDPTVRAEAILACQQVLEDSPALHRIIYRSRSLMSPLGMEKLLQHAQANNQVLKVTGVLAHWDQQLVQVLEGPRETIIGLLQTIRCDPRHYDFTLLSSQPITRRRFGRWLMADMALDPDEFATLAANFEGSGDRLERRISAWMKAR